MECGVFISISVGSSSAVYSLNSDCKGNLHWIYTVKRVTQGAMKTKEIPCGGDTTI